MSALEFSEHAEQRLRQRGIPRSQINLVLQFGTPVDAGAYILTHANADEAIAERKREIQSLERLRGCKVVLSRDVVLTAYRPEGKGQRRMMRRVRAGHE